MSGYWFIQSTQFVIPWSQNSRTYVTSNSALNHASSRILEKRPQRNRKLKERIKFIKKIFHQPQGKGEKLMISDLVCLSITTEYYWLLHFRGLVRQLSKKQQKGQRNNNRLNVKWAKSLIAYRHPPFISTCYTFLPATWTDKQNSLKQESIPSRQELVYIRKYTANVWP